MKNLFLACLDYLVQAHSLQLVYCRFSTLEFSKKAFKDFNLRGLLAFLEIMKIDYDYPPTYK